MRELTQSLDDVESGSASVSTSSSASAVAASAKRRLPSPEQRSMANEISYAGGDVEKEGDRKLQSQKGVGGRQLAVPSTPLMSLLAAISYGAASLAMVFLNKGVLMMFKYSLTLLTLQMLASAILIHSLWSAGWVTYRPFNLATARNMLPLSLCYNANVAFALASLAGVNIPMYIALKRLTPLAVLITGFFRGKAKPPLQITLSVLATTLGCVIAAAGDFAFDPYAYALALTSVGFQTGYLVLVEYSGAESGMTSSEIMLYNAVLSLPVLSVLIIATGEASVSFPTLIQESARSSGFAMAVLISLVMGIVLNFTMFWCTICNSALTTTIVGVLKGVFTTVLGFFVLGGVKFQALNVTGLAINSLGGVWYSIAKYRQKPGGSRPMATPLQEQQPLLSVQQR